MKNKEIIFELTNDWQFLFGKYNWTTFTFIQLYIEHEKWLKGWDLHFTLLGLGVYIRFNYDVKFLDDKLNEWGADLEELEDGDL
jgi:hypothetical protein